MVLVLNIEPALHMHFSFFIFFFLKGENKLKINTKFFSLSTQNYRFLASQNPKIQCPPPRNR